MRVRDCMLSPVRGGGVSFEQIIRNTVLNFERLRFWVLTLALRALRPRGMDLPSIVLRRGGARSVAVALDDAHFHQTSLHEVAELALMVIPEDLFETLDALLRQRDAVVAPTLGGQRSGARGRGKGARCGRRMRLHPRV